MHIPRPPAALAGALVIAPLIACQATATPTTTPSATSRPSVADDGGAILRIAYTGAG